MASAKPSALAVYDNTWTSVWTKPGGCRGKKRFGNAKKVPRREAERRYREWLVDWTPEPEVHSYRMRDITVGELIDRYVEHMYKHQRKPDVPRLPNIVKNGSRANAVRLTLRLLKNQCGSLLAKHFGPLMLTDFQDLLIKRGGNRKTVNGGVGTVKSAFKWAGGRQQIAPEIYHGLLTIGGLRTGETTVPEQKKRTAAVLSDVKETMKHLDRYTAGVLDLLYLADMRPEEACLVRMCDVNTTPDENGCWTYTPQTHKTAHLGKGREIKLGPAAQDLLNRFRVFREDDYLFKTGSARVTLTPQIHTNMLWQRITRVCKKHDIPRWFPYQIRHLRNTEIEARFGRHAAKACSGHSSEEVTEGYIDRDDLSLASKIMAQVG